MKRAFPQKIKPVPARALDSDAVAKQLKHALPEGHRRARTSAAMIGLAISMGASSLLLHRESDRAVAAEPLAAEPTSTVVPSSADVVLEVQSLVPNAEAKLITEDTSTTLQIELVPQQVEEESSLWQLAETQEVSVIESDATSSLATEPVLKEEQQLNTLGNGIVPGIQAAETVETASASYENRFDPAIGQSQFGQDRAPVDEVNDKFLKAKQDIALDRLKESSNRLRDSLAELRFEEYTSESTEPSVEAVQSTAEANLSLSPEIDRVVVPNAAIDAVELAEQKDSENLSQVPAATLQQPLASVIPNVTIKPETAASTPAPITVIPESVASITPNATLKPANPLSSPITVAPTVPSTVVPSSASVAPSTTVKPIDRLSSPSSAAPLPATIIPKSTTAPAPSTAVIPLAPAQTLESSVAPAAPQTAVTPAPRLVIEPANPEASNTRTAQPDLTPVVVIPPQAPASQEPTEVYKVNPGDTLSTIAQNFGISSTQLAAANQIDDPDFIRVNQQLRLGLAQPDRQTSETVALVSDSSSATASGTNTANDESVSDTTVPSVILTNQTTSSPNPTIPSAPSLSASETNSVAFPIVPAIEQETQIAATDAGTEVSSSNEPNQRPQSQANTSSTSYVQDLMAEIQRMRQKYPLSQRASNPNSADTTVIARNLPSSDRPLSAPLNSDRVTESLETQVRQQQSQTDARPRQTQVNTSAPAIALPASEQTSQQLNPEVNPNRYTEELQAEIRQLQQRQMVQPPQARLNLPTTEMSQPDEQVVATAPLGADAYGPLSEPRMVSPQLPPLPSPDTYLPNGPSQFNGYSWPAEGVLTSGYGWRWGRMHKGIDIAAPIGTPIYAVAPGVVTYAGWNDGGYGNLVEIEHPDGSVTVYGHNDRVLVQEGQVVDQGQQISEMGSTGYSTGPHLHFEIHPNGDGAVDPLAYLPQ